MYAYDIFLGYLDVTKVLSLKYFKNIYTSICTHVLISFFYNMMYDYTYFFINII